MKKLLLFTVLAIGAIGIIAGPRPASDTAPFGPSLQPPVCLPGDPPPCNVGKAGKRPGR